MILESPVNVLSVIPVAALLFGAIIQLILARVLSPRTKGWLALLFCLAGFAAVLAMIPTIASGKKIEVTLLPWDTGLPLQYHIDGLSIVFALMATGIGSAILLYSVDYMAHEPAGVTRFYALMLAFIAGLVNLVCSSNLLLVYLSWEVIGLCSYFLVGFWYKEPASVNGARKVLIMTHLPGYALLIAILLLYSRSGTFLWTDPRLVASFTTGIFLLMLVAAMAKSVQYPLHTWIPEAMNAPTPVSALLHSACYVKAGVYLVARMYSFSAPGTHWPIAWNTLILIIGCITMLVGAFFAIKQTDLKRLLAFSTISQLGYIITGLGLGTSFGVAAGLFYCLSHGLFKGTLFLGAGAVQQATGTRDMRKLGGLAKVMPRIGLLWIVVAAAIVGVPLTNGFVAKWFLYNAALASGQWIVFIIAWLVSTLTAFYMLKATVSVFYGDMPDWLKERKVKEAPFLMQIGMGVLAALCLVLGLAPQALMQWVVSPAVKALGFSWNLSFTWLGIQTTSPGVSGIAGVVVVLLALVIGWIIYHLIQTGSSPSANVFTGGDPLPADDFVGTVDFADIAESAFQPVYKAVDPDPAYLFLWTWIKKLSAATGRIFQSLEQRPFLSAIILAVIVISAVWLI
jgi:multicomponent Na+:H+ antiporter subunit A